MKSWVPAPDDRHPPTKAVTVQPFRAYDQDLVARRMAEQAKLQADGAWAAMAQVVPSFGTAAVPALALGASATVVVALSVEMPNVNYIAIPVLLGSAGLLGSLTLNGIVAKTTASVTVSVKAPVLAVAAGAQIQVVAFRAG